MSEKDNSLMNGSVKIKSEPNSKSVGNNSPLDLDGGNNFFTHLGFKEGTHHFYIKQTCEIFKTSTFTNINLLNLAPAEYWQKIYPQETDKPREPFFSLYKASNRLIRNSHAKGMFNLKNVRSAGVWNDDGRIVINCGKNLVVGGEIKEISEFNSKFSYVQSERELPPLTPPLSDMDCQLAIEGLKAFKWSRACDHKFLGGWLMLSNIGGLLRVRPNIWLTGSKGTGKSTVFEMVKKLTHKGKISTVGSVTEAGVRQTAKGMAVPFICDEFEGRDQASIARVEKTIEFLRSCWSDTEAETLKGTPSGQPLSFNSKLIACLASINVCLPTEADRSRFTILELLHHSSDPEIREADKNRIDDALEWLSEDFGSALLYRAVSLVSVIEANFKTLSRIIGRRRDSRDGDQYGMLLAGWAAMNGTKVLNADEAKELADEVLAVMGDSSDQGDIISDEEECLNHLLSWRVRLTPENSEKAVELSIADAINAREIRSQLTPYGIRAGENYFLVANQHAELKKIFKDTRWADSNWQRSLKRIKGAEATGCQSFGGRDFRSKTVKIPRQEDDSCTKNIAI